MSDLIADDYLRHTDFEPWGDDRIMFAGQGDVLRAPDDERPAFVDAAGDDDYGRDQ